MHPPDGPQAEASFDPLDAARGRVGVIAGLAVVGAVARVVPLIAVVELARTLAPGLSGAPVDAGRAWVIVAVAAVTQVVAFACSGTSVGLGHAVDNDMQLEVRTRVVAHLRRLPLGWFDDRSSGVVRRVAENDVAKLHQLVAHAITDTVTAVTVPTLSLIYLFVVDWRMALATVLIIVAAVGVFAWMMRDSGEKYVEYEAGVSRLSSTVVEYVHGIAVVKAFGQGGRSLDRYRDRTGGFVRFYDRWMRETAVAMIVGEVLTTPVVVLAYLCAVGAWLVGHGQAAPLDVLPALVIGTGLAGPLLQMGFTGQYLREAREARASLRGFFAEPVVPMPAPGAGREITGDGVAFEGVTFGYEADSPVLHDITAACAPGTVTALVGGSGSGKSTLARLVPRFYDVDSGAVRLGEVDVRDVPEASLYGQVGFVFQDAYLLRTSVRDNIRLTRPDADDEAVIAAARAARIHERILRLPRGYDSVIGDDAHLSGGEAQRLTIARALLTDAPVLVLDEATAFADPDSEAAIQEGLSRLARGRTLLVIAHRLHTITGADRILVLDGGRVVESGTHEQLLAADGRYARMWERYESVRAASLPDTLTAGGTR